MPPESAFARKQLGGLTDAERISVAGLRLGHAQLEIAALAATSGKVHAPPLQDFIPDLPSEPEPAKPLTFLDWAHALMPLAGGRV